MNTHPEARRGASRLVGPLAAAVCLVLAAPDAKSGTRAELVFPAPPGYVTLKCDLHVHTVFSDGLVWPTVRIEEAWQDGLDALALTDHLEYLPHKADLGAKYGRSHALALGAAQSLGILLVRAAEITRGEPPGHFNALFLTNVATVAAYNTNDFRDAVKAAIDQGAFLFWNHPGWKQPDGKSVWYKEQGELLERGWLHGLEVVNGEDYDPIVHGWCRDRKLTMVANSDVHDPIGMDYDPAEGAHRPMTLVFARKKSAPALKEGLQNRRTVLWTGKMLVGEPEHLLPIFHGSLELRTPQVKIKAKGSGLVAVYNRGPVTFQLERAGTLEEVSLPRKVELRAGRTSLLNLQGRTNTLEGVRTLALPFKAMNLKTAPDESLPVELKVDVAFSK